MGEMELDFKKMYLRNSELVKYQVVEDLLFIKQLQVSMAYRSH